jgi:mono/diheme cytochrome c family protein
MNSGTNRNPGLLFALILTLLLIGFALVGCGQRQAAGPTPTPPPTVTPLSAAFQQPTTIIKEADSTTKSAEPAPTPTAALSRGETIYTNRNCGDCHGPQGEGVQDKGQPLVGTALTAEEFETILRTGGQGSLGNDHLYGTQSISPSGMAALYDFIKSLPAP